LGGGTGTFVVTFGSGSYAALALGSLGTITDLDVSTAPAGPPLATPIDPFVVAPVAPRFVFNLEQILAGGGADCFAGFPPVGGSCSPNSVVPTGISPFLLSQKQGAVAASLSVRGTVTDLLDGTSAPYKGLFTFNVTTYSTIADLLAALGPGGPGFVESSWSAELNSVPEPASVFTFFGGLGLVGLGLWRKRS